MKRTWFKTGTAVVFDPPWDMTATQWKRHPLKRGEVVYYLTDIPNVRGHCIVAKWTGEVVSMVHPEDFRKANESEL